MARIPLFIPIDRGKLRGRPLGRCCARDLREGQEFRSLTTGLEGYVLGHERRGARKIGHKRKSASYGVRVLLDTGHPTELEERRLHPNVIVEAL